MVLKGNPVSPGIARGKTYVYKAFSCAVHQAFFEGDAQKYKDAFDAAVAEAEAELDALVGTFSEKDADKAKIFGAHKEILFDEEILEMVQDAILSEKKMPDSAVFDVFAEFIQLLSGAKDALIAARVADLRDVRNRLVRILHGEPERNLSVLDEPVIIVAHDLLPSDTATLDRKNVLGIITEVGGATSHSAIIANSYRIPAVLGVPDATKVLRDGVDVGLDALEGVVYVQPDDACLAQLEDKKAEFARQQAIAQQFLDKEGKTADGTRIDIGLNIGSAEYVEGYKHSDFVGLFRTEFLYMESDHQPTEQEQFKAYRKVLENMGGKPVTLRTLDIGGDKKLPYMQLPQEDNPFLGKRALRLCFDNPALFRDQLRAALRASVYGKLWLMLPMVGSLDDIRRARTILEDVQAELDKEGVAYDREAKFGIMIEIPSIAMIAELAADEVDFASIGTNDLCQYLCAVDRMNPGLDSYYQSYSPAMVRTLGYIIEQFNSKGKPISVCGEMGGEVLGALLLVGLGLRKLSMSESRLAGVKAALSKVTVSQLEQAAQQAKALQTEQEVLSLLRALLD